MITYKTGNILAEAAEALVNTVNCVGIMGRGIALQFKRAFPDNFKAYAARCKRDQMRPGRVFVFETGQILPPRYIINFPTKRHWRGKSRIEDIESGLESLTREIRSRGIRSIAIPPLGSGLGGLHWPSVRARMEAVLSYKSKMLDLASRNHPAKKIPSWMMSRLSSSSRPDSPPALHHQFPGRIEGGGKSDRAADGRANRSRDVPDDDGGAERRWSGFSTVTCSACWIRSSRCWKPTNSCTSCRLQASPCN